MAQILIADDEEVIRRVLKECLEFEGHQVRVVEDGDEALKSHRQTPAEIIIMDLVMPEKEGIETIIELRRTYSNVKIIAISGTSLVNLEMARLLGADASLEKPLDLDLLMEMIDSLLKD